MNPAVEVLVREQLAEIEHRIGMNQNHVDNLADQLERAQAELGALVTTADALRAALPSEAEEESE